MIIPNDHPAVASLRDLIRQFSSTCNLSFVFHVICDPIKKTTQAKVSHPLAYQGKVSRRSYLDINKETIFSRRKTTFISVIGLVLMLATSNAFEISFNAQSDLFQVQISERKNLGKQISRFSLFRLFNT